MIRIRPARWPRRQYAVSQPGWTSVDCFLSCVEVFGFFKLESTRNFIYFFRENPWDLCMPSSFLCPRLHPRVPSPLLSPRLHPPKLLKRAIGSRVRLSAGNVENTPLTVVHVALWHSTVVRRASWKIGSSTVAYATTYST